MSYVKAGNSLPVLSVVDDGVLKGYVPLHKDWTGFSSDIVRKAAESVLSSGQTDPEDNNSKDRETMIDISAR